MDFRKSMVVALCSAMLTGGINLMLPGTAVAESYKRISIKPGKPGEEIGRDAILSRVDALYPGNRKLGVHETPTADYPECTTVKIMFKGEVISLKVACG